jgi:hypothetical protein
MEKRTIIERHKTLIDWIWITPDNKVRTGRTSKLCKRVNAAKEPINVKKSLPGCPKKYRRIGKDGKRQKMTL